MLPGLDGRRAEARRFRDLVRGNDLDLGLFRAEHAPDARICEGAQDPRQRRVTDLEALLLDQSLVDERMNIRTARNARAFT